jgi:cobalamin biosynthesis protein CobD/CbiB
VRLGGPRSYGGRPYEALQLHPEGRPPSVRDARAALSLVAIVSGLAFGVSFALIARRRRR